MTYSGNPSLSPEVRQRILGTFEQTLQLAGEGSRQEALLGCDFVLRMDPQFEPARVLQERLKASAGPVRVDDLLAAGSAFAAPPEPDDPFGSLDGLGLDLPDLPGLEEAAPPGGGLRDDFQSLLEQRRFQELLTAASQNRPAVTADPELQRIVTTAQERMEAEPYLMKFLTSARQALQTGNAAEVARLLDKAKSLDPSHPEIAVLERLGRAPSAPPVAAPAPAPVQIPAPFPAAAMPAATLAFGGSGDSESERRIRELLDEGQAALDKGDPQGAIDAWSRIFLIDIDHQEAARRIEVARRQKAENERQVEEVFHDGLARLEVGDAVSAQRAFQRVLELQPGHFAAREYLQQIASGNVPTPRPGNLREMPAIAPNLPLPADLDDAESLREEILVPPEPPGGKGGKTAERRTAAKAPAAKSGGEGRARRLFLMVGGAVLLLALAAGAWFFLNRDSVFPNSGADEESSSTAPLPGSDPIARAERLHKAGKTDLAVKQLKLIPESDPNHARAQKLIAEWEEAPAPAVPGAAAPGTAPAANPEAPAVAATPEASQRRQALLAAAREAYGERSYLKALNRLEQAAALGRLEGADASLQEDVRRKLAPIAQEIDLFRQHEWEFILPKLWRMREENPGDRDIDQLIVDCYYNLGVRDLQRADAVKAAEKFQEALNLRPDDPLLRRHLMFAQTYEQRQKDLLYRIYVKYLPYR